MLDKKFMGRVTAMYKYQRDTENLTSVFSVPLWIIPDATSAL